MKVSLITLGCRVNQSESAVLEGTLEENGVTIVGLSNKPDICIINTCTVTSKSDANSRQLIRKAAKAGAKVIVTGCYSQLNKEEVLGIPGVIRVIDNKDKTLIAGLITNSEPNLIFHRHGNSRPFLKVQDGCNYRCTYCAVWPARGRSWSVPLDDVIDRVKSMSASGAQEIVLTGIHLGSYGHDFAERLTIANLLRAIIERTNIFRVRLSSLEINEIDDELLELMQEKRVCSSLHIPLQSGSDKVLGLMRRNYDSTFFRSKLKIITNRLGEIGLGTDVIVGFPGEGNAEFRETYELIESMPFTYLHVFPYSPRPNTEAIKLTGRPSADLTKSSVDKLLELSSLKKRRFMRSQIGRRLEVVMEDYRNDGFGIGTSSNYLKVSARNHDFRKGSIEYVRPVRVLDDMLEGVLIINR